MDGVGLYVSVPIASFRVPQAREYLESLPCPPPSTVYGMLLSLVGEQDRLRHEGAEVALGVFGRPERSVVLRTLWRVKSQRSGPGLEGNRRPDFQELLSGVKLAVWIRPGEAEDASPTLCERVAETLANPRVSSRFGGLSLGESSHLVDELRLLREGDPDELQLLVRDPSGDLSMPVWPDHVGSSNTAWEQFRLMPRLRSAGLPLEAWAASQRAQIT